jgi:maleate cis-trans isomerase
LDESVHSHKTDPIGIRPADLMTPRARLGVIIPSSNRLSEPQLQHYAPNGLAVHVTRLRMTGPWHKPISALHDEIRAAAGALADSKCDVICFHCTGGAMEEGPEVEARVIELINEETGATALATGTAIVQALKALAIRSLVLLTPYRPAVNEAERAYLGRLGFEVMHDIGLNLKGGDEYIHVPPERWLDLARDSIAAHPGADGIFLSCTNTTQIEAIPAIERSTGKPCVNSNQAVLWAVTRTLAPKLGSWPREGRLGRLFGNA